MIKLENVTKNCSSEVTALRDASFDIAKAEFVFLVGLAPWVRARARRCA